MLFGSNDSSTHSNAIEYETVLDAMTTIRQSSPAVGNRAPHLEAIRSGIPLSPEERHRSLGPSPISWQIVVPAARRENALEGTLLGCAVADALSHALASSDRVEARQQINKHLRAARPLLALPGDRTHAMILTIQAILLSRASVDEFGKALRKRVAWYRAAHGFESVYECLKRNASPAQSISLVAGLGKDPTVRAAILSVILQGHGKGGLRWVQQSTITTHPDALVANAAMLVAVASQCAQMSGTSFEIPSDDFMHVLSQTTTQPVLRERLILLGQLLQEGRSLKRAARSLGYSHAMTGNLVDNALLSIYAWRRYGDDYRVCMERILGLSGDVYSIAAIAGALIGTQRSVAAIPAEWLEQTSMDPHDTRWRERFVERVRDWPHGPEDIQRTLPLPVMPIGQWKRNLRFACWKGWLQLRKKMGRVFGS